jgi:hypothetical protein
MTPQQRRQKEAAEPRLGYTIEEIDRLRAALSETRQDLQRLRKANKRLYAVLDATHKLVTEGATVGFIPTEGTWAERLYANQGQIHQALNEH